MFIMNTALGQCCATLGQATVVMKSCESAVISLGAEAMLSFCGSSSGVRVHGAPKT